MTETRPHSQPLPPMSPASPDTAGDRRHLWPELATAWSSLLLFVVALVVTVRATEYSWDVEADYALAPDADQSLYGLAFFVYAVMLAPAALGHLVSVTVATYRTVRARPRGGAGWPLVWVAYVLGVVSVAAVCALGIEFVRGLDGVPEDVRDRALFLLGAPFLVVSLAGLVPLAFPGWTRAARRA